MDRFISQYAIVEENAEIGDGSKVWHFSHIMEGAKIGRDCVIGEKVFIGKNVLIGDNVHIANGANLYDGVIVRNNVFIGNNASFTNVRYPRAWRKAAEYIATVVEENATVGANAVVMAGVIIGKNSTIGDGAVVVQNVSQGGHVIGPKGECICGEESCTFCRNKAKREFYKHNDKKQQHGITV